MNPIKECEKCKSLFKVNKEDLIKTEHLFIYAFSKDEISPALKGKCPLCNYPYYIRLYED